MNIKIIQALANESKSLEEFATKVAYNLNHLSGNGEAASTYDVNTIINIFNPSID